MRLDVGLEPGVVPVATKKNVSGWQRIRNSGFKADSVISFAGDHAVATPMAICGGDCGHPFADAGRDSLLVTLDRVERLREHRSLGWSISSSRRLPTRLVL